MGNEIKWIIPSVKGEEKHHHCVMPPPPPMHYDVDLLKGTRRRTRVEGDDRREVRSESNRREEQGKRERNVYCSGKGGNEF